MNEINNDYELEWAAEVKQLAAKSVSTIWIITPIVLPFFAFFEFDSSNERFFLFLYIFLSVSALMLAFLFLKKKNKLPEVISNYGASIILATCFSYMAALTELSNVHNYLMGVSAITMVRGMLYFGKMKNLIIVTLINHTLAIGLILTVRNESFGDIPVIGSTLFYGIIFMIFSFAGMNKRYHLTKENFINESELKRSFDIIEEKQPACRRVGLAMAGRKEILDSIHYAKRIQTALLPSEKYFNRNLTRTITK